MGPSELIVALLAVWIVLFIVFRAFWLWFWKVNELVGLLKQIRDELRAIRAAAGPPPAPVVSPPPEVAPRQPVS